MRVRSFAVVAALAASCLSVVGTSATADDSDTQPETLQVDPDARVEADDVVTDDPTDEEDVSLPPIDGTGDSYVVDTGGNRHYFSDSTEARGGTWWDGVCTDGENRYSVVKDYDRDKDHPRMERSYARMYCGKKLRHSQPPDSEAAFGIRHIRYRHKKDFGKLASWQGSTWGNLHWAISWVMSEPSIRTVQGPTRFCYDKKFTFMGPGGDTAHRRVIVILGETGVRIMTSFPRKGKGYCKGPDF